MPAGYSQLFQERSKKSEVPQKVYDFGDRAESENETNKHLGMLPPVIDPRKLEQVAEAARQLKLKSQPRKDPKVQVVDGNKFFDRRKTFIKNWDEDDEV